MNQFLRASLFCLGSVLLLSGCDAGTQTTTATDSAALISDAELQTRVEAALAGATDLPQDIDVAVSDGVVTISGSLACEDCGGMRTPGNVGTVQQSLGAVVRAVPGVEDVRLMFLLSYDVQ